ncbi:hypothetical protein CYMTET_25121, partial [Cymbomonas tetramitiformis]
YVPAVAYMRSKLLLSAHACELHRRYHHAGLSSIVVDPGAVDSRITRLWPRSLRWLFRRGMWCLGLLGSPEDGALAVMAAVSSDENLSGVYMFGRSGCQLQASSLSLDENIGQQCWDTLI